MMKIWEYFKKKNKFNEKKKLQKGISIIALVITIILIIILAALAFMSGGDSINDAAIASYRHELKDVEVSVSATRIDNQKNGIGEEIKEAGFYPIIIENPPENFVSFGTDEFYGYIVDLEYINSEETKRGHDYKKYLDKPFGETIIFGEQGKDNDVYIYDSTGKVFYAKGIYVEGGVYYSDILTIDGPIIRVEKIYDPASNIVNLVINVEPVSESPSELILRVNNEKIEPESDGSYKYTATSNDTYIITAEEDSERVSIKRVNVSEITEGEYNITYHFQDEGVTPDLTVIKYGSTPIRLMNAKRDGYKLVGWSKLPTATSGDYRPGDLFVENVDTDLYAVWELGEPREFVITLNPNGGEYPIDSVTNEQIKDLPKTERVTITLPVEEPTRNGHMFLGWAESSSATEPVYLAGGEYTKEGDNTLFAVWQEGAIRVDIAVNPVGAGTAVGDGIKEEGSIVYISAAANPGYSFYKWTVESSNVILDNNYAETTRFTMPKGTVRLTAEFKETDYDYTIRYNANNGSGAPNTQYKKHNEDINISTVIPTRSAHRFLGWATSINATSVEYAPGSVYSGNKSITLYAVWEKNTDECTLTFNANGGTNAPSSITKIKGSVINIPTDTPRRSNLLFLGWSENSKASEPTYRKNDTYIMSGDAVLYAVWSDTEKPVVYITAEEKDNNLVLNGNALDNGGVVSYAWTDKFYSETEQSSITWINLNNSRLELTIPYDVLKSGVHCFYAKDEDGNVSYASIDVYMMTFYADGVLVDTKYKAAGYEASLSKVVPEKPMYAFNNWKSLSDGRDYMEDEKYLLNKDESFSAEWSEAVAYIPSTNKYYLTTQHAVNAVPANTSEYVLIQLLRDETTEGVTIKDNKMVSYSTGAFTLNSSKTAIAIEKGSSFKLVDGTITSSIDGIINKGNLAIDSGRITAPNGIVNEGNAVVGNENEAFSREAVIISSTVASYKMNPGGTLEFVNGEFIDYKNDSTGNTYEVPTSGLTLRNGFDIRKIGSSSSSAIITTLVEDLVITSEVLAGTEERAVEVRVTLSCANNNYTFEHSTDNVNWLTGKTVILIDNKTVYGRIKENNEIANTAQLKISNIVDLVLTLDGGGVITNPASVNVKYKREYGSAIPNTTSTSSHTFLGWYTAKSGGEKVTANTTVTATTDHTLYARWEPKNFTVTLDPTGGSVNPTSIEVTYGETYEDLPTPSRTGYKFLGWHTSPTETSRIYLSTTVTITANQTLYAHWQMSSATCACAACTNTVSKSGSLCGTCADLSWCGTHPEFCVIHCEKDHPKTDCACDRCSADVVNGNHCSTCYSHKICNQCNNCDFHYDICSTCGYCSVCVCQCTYNTGTTDTPDDDDTTGGTTSETNHSYSFVKGGTLGNGCRQGTCTYTAGYIIVGLECNDCDFTKAVSAGKVCKCGKFIGSNSSLSAAIEEWQAYHKYNYYCACKDCSNGISSDDDFCDSCVSKCTKHPTSGYCKYHCTYDINCACVDCLTIVSTEGEWCASCQKEGVCEKHEEYCELHCILHYECLCNGCDEEVTIKDTYCDYCSETKKCTKHNLGYCEYHCEEKYKGTHKDNKCECCGAGIPNGVGQCDECKASTTCKGTNCMKCYKHNSSGWCTDCGFCEEHHKIATNCTATTSSTSSSAPSTSESAPSTSESAPSTSSSAPSTSSSAPSTSESAPSTSGSAPSTSGSAPSTSTSSAPAPTST